VQKPEIIDKILALKRRNPTIQNKELALQLRCHRNTISKYVKYIRKNYVKTPEEIVNKIDDKLDEELEGMTHRDLIQYRRSVTPTKIEAHSIEETREIKLMWIKNESNTPDKVPASQGAK